MRVIAIAFGGILAMVVAAASAAEGDAKSKTNDGTSHSVAVGKSVITDTMPTTIYFGVTKYLDKTGADRKIIYQGVPGVPMSPSDIANVRKRFADESVFSHRMEILLDNQPIQSRLIKQEDLMGKLQEASKKNIPIREITVRRSWLRTAGAKVAGLATIILITYDLFDPISASTESKSLASVRAKMDSVPAQPPVVQVLCASQQPNCFSGNEGLAKSLAATK